jgi:DNA-binding LytR/AlgR family response regulator
MVKCIIIDDEPLAISVIEDHLSKINEFEVVGTFSNPLEAISLIQSREIDVIFLDINMPVISGIDFVKSLTHKPLIVMTTAYREFAVESFELDVLDYLIKPIPFSRFIKTVSKINDNFDSKSSSEEDREHLFLKIDKKMVKVYLDEILFIESLKDYIKITTTTGTHLMHQTLTSFTSDLPEENFIRVHRSYTINIPKVKAIVGNIIEIDKHQVPIGRNYVQEVKDRILN